MPQIPQAVRFPPMHELSVMEGILNVVLKHARQHEVQRVVAVSLRIGEMTDLAGLAEFPQPAYTCKQFSSYDRKSKSPTEEWFANADAGQYLRVEENDGRKEFVMMDAAGPGAIVVELGLGLLLLVGFKTRLSAIVLAVFTVAAAVFFHNYWALPADKAFMHQLMFWKNVAIAGGLLGFAAFGAGRLSIDGRK